MKFILSALISYAIGCLNPAYLLSRLKGFDIREQGTTNAGATNAMFSLGLWWGVLVMVLDIGKTLCSIRLTGLLCRNSLSARVLSGFFCALGHIFPAPLRFRGGKGTACLAALILYFNPVLFLPIVICTFGVGILLDRASLLPPLVSMAYPVIFLLTHWEFIPTLLLCLMIPLILWSHRANFARYQDGKETGMRKFLFGRDLDACIERQQSMHSK